MLRLVRFRRGFSLIEGLLGLAILAGVIVAVTRYLLLSQDLQSSRVLATRWANLSLAADNYIKKSDAAIRQALNPQAGGNTVLVIPMLSSEVGNAPFNTNFSDQQYSSFQSAGVLGQSFADSSLGSQKTALVIFIPEGLTYNQYEAFLTSYGGSAVSDSILTGAEGMSEGRVGAILANDPQGSGQIRGARAGWTAPTSILAQANLPGGTPGPGHLVSYISLERSGFDTANTYLDRVLSANPEDNTMETDILFDNNPSDPIGLTGLGQITPGVDINGSKRLQINGSLTALGDVRSQSGMAAPVYYSLDPNDPTQYDPSYFVAPDQTSKVNILTAQKFDLDAIAYSTSGAINMPATMRLADLIPSHIDQATYLVGDGAVINKPACSGGGATAGPANYAQARIIGYFISQFNTAGPTVDVSTTVTYQEIPVVSTFNLSGSSPTYTITTTEATTNSFQGISSTSQTTASDMLNTITATDNGSSWTVHLSTYTTDASGNQVLVPSPANMPNQAIVQSSCYFNHLN